MISRFTGERHGRGELFSYDEARHQVAYAYALENVRGKRVLDAGCGDGAGTSTLSPAAAEVVGIDVSDELIASWSSVDEHDNLSFERRDLTSSLTDLGQFDVVVCFQVIEHIEADTLFLARLRDVIAPEGTLLLTTPNVLMSIAGNPYHVREYTPQQLRRTLGDVFERVHLVGVHGNEKVAAYDLARRRFVDRVLRLDPLGVRRILPRRFVEWSFARLAVAVRRSVRTKVPEPFDPSDFVISSERIERALDLLAICQP